MSAPRIDTVRNLIDSLTRMLTEYRPDLEDIHDLAYDRHKAKQSDPVDGGDRDYALDRYGDMRSRELYTDVAARMVGLGRALESDLKAVRRHLNKDTGRPLRRTTTADVTAEELLQATAARDRRLSLEHHTPHRLVAQPQRKVHLDPVTELEHLRNAVRRITGRLDLEHTDCRDSEGRRKPKWLDRAQLSPAMRDAFDRAVRPTDQQQAS